MSRQSGIRALAVIALLAGSVAALTLARPGAANPNDDRPGQGFVGAWRLSTETPFGASQSLITLTADGTVQFSDRPVFPGDAGFPVTFFSAGHGSWEQTGDDIAAATWVFFMTDGEGNFLGVVTDSAEMILEADGASWSGPFSSSTADPAGNLLFVGGGTVRASRIAVEPLATPITGTPTA